MQKLSYESGRNLLRCPSSPSYQQAMKYGTNTTIHTSTSSIESVDDESRKNAIKWLMEFDRKVTKDTNYLSVWYLEIALRNGLLINLANWQLCAAAIMMLASKMNEIYPPSVASVIKRCKHPIGKQALIEMQGRILNILGFNIAVQSPYNLLSQILEDSKKDIEECEKLLKIIVYHKEINQQEAQTLAHAIIYLIARSRIDQKLQGEGRTKVKLLAQKIYTYYKDIRKAHEQQKSKTIISSSQQTSNSLKQSSSKQNLTPCNSTEAFYTKSQHLVTFKKTPSYFSSLSRANSFKFIPQFQQTTNLKEKKLYHCLSKEELRENQRKVMYMYS